MRLKKGNAHQRVYKTITRMKNWNVFWICKVGKKNICALCCNLFLLGKGILLALHDKVVDRLHYVFKDT